MSKIRLDDILKLPYRRIKEIAQEHKEALSARDYDRISEISHLHVLKLKLLDKYKDFFSNVLVESLREEAGKRTIDGSIVRLLRDNPEDIPTFEQYKRDKMTATSMHGEGNIFEVCSILRKGLVAKTFATIFSDKRRFKRAYSAYDFIGHMKESIEADYNDEENPDHVFARNIVKRLRPVKPKYGRNNTLAVTFVDANDIHDEAAIKGLDVGQRIEYLREVSDIYIAQTVFGKTKIGDGTLIKKGSYVRTSSQIGENVIIEPNSFCQRVIPPNEVWGGVPARFIRKNE